MLWLAIQMLRALPMWLTVCALRPFLDEKHPFKRRMTLAVWTMNATPFAFVISDALWISILWATAAVVVYYRYVA